MKILYIEDNKKLADLVCTLLRGRGYEVEYFALGKPGLERFYQDFQSWDAVIIDLELPDVAGQTLLPEMVAQRPGLPIVVYSGVNGVKQQFELFSSGASAVLSKPTPGQDLIDVLQHLIETPPEPIS
jgi:DNA-binding response OmpR family regulator